MDYNTRINEYCTVVDRALGTYLPKGSALQKNLFDAMEYSTMSGGKRIRPLLVLEFCRVCGGRVEDALPFACAVEFVHTYSLIHDDLPCMDDDAMRRGRPSCHVRFGYATALLAGDALLSLAFETALCDNKTSMVTPENRIRAVGMLARASGAIGMVGGQVIDLESEGHAVNVEILSEMHRGKTGAMIKAAAQMGCLAANAGDARVKAAGVYAAKLGHAFQIVDDILDSTESSETLGKPAGSDEDNGKSTYVTCMGAEKSRTLAAELTAGAVEGLSVFGSESDFLKELAVRLLNRRK